MAETPARYCSNCGHELSTEDQFCPNCGSAVHESATVPTPEADVPVPPPPPQTAAAAGPPPHQAEGAPQPRSRRNLFIAGCLGLIGVLALLIIAIVAIVALSDGGGDEPAKKDDPSAGVPANTPESTPTSTPESTPESTPAGDDAGAITMSDVRMAADENGEQPTTEFGPNDTFYCVGNLEDAPDDTKVTAVWIASDVKNIEPNSKIKQISARGGSGLFRFNLSPVDSWPTGEYAVQLYLNDAENPTKALTFEVR